MDKFGLLGRHLGHSYSPQIHARLYAEPYGLCEVEPDELGVFLRDTDVRGLNVTIPYKKDVIPYCAALSDTAARIGSVNTLVRRSDGWYGDNTDYDGFRYMVRHSGVDVKGKKALVLGDGGVSLTVRTVLSDLGCADIVVVSRRGENNYENLHRHADAHIIANCTPVGMYPNNGESLVDLANFPACEAVYDMIYNPCKTALLLQAEERGMVWENGLGMLVAQAKRAAELFQETVYPDEKVEEIRQALWAQMGNIVLIGMPGCGKSSIGAALSAVTGLPLVDADEELVKAAGLAIPEIFAAEGEEGFRRRETETLRELSKRSGCIIATGGGCVTRAENRALLRQNGTTVWIRRSLDELPSDGRPLSQRHGVQTLYARRKDKYAAFADLIVDNDRSIAEAAAEIKEKLL